MKEKFTYKLPFGLIANMNPSKKAEKDYDRFIEKCKEDDIYPYSGKLRAAYRNLPPIPLGFSAFSPQQTEILLQIVFAIQDTKEYQYELHRIAQENIGQGSYSIKQAAIAYSYWPITLNQLYDQIYQGESKHRNRKKMGDLKNNLLRLAKSICVFSVPERTQFQEGWDISSFGNYSEKVKGEVQELNSYLKESAIQDTENKDEEFQEYVHVGLSVGAPITLSPLPPDNIKQEVGRIRKDDLWGGSQGDGSMPFYILLHPALSSFHQWRYIKGNPIQEMKEWKKENGEDSRRANEVSFKLFSYLAAPQVNHAEPTDIRTTSPYPVFAYETLRIAKDKNRIFRQRYKNLINDACRILKGIGIIKSYTVEKNRIVFVRNANRFRLSETCQKEQKIKQEKIRNTTWERTNKQLKNLRREQGKASWTDQKRIILNQLEDRIRKLPRPIR